MLMLSNNMQSLYIISLGHLFFLYARRLMFVKPQTDVVKLRRTISLIPYLSIGSRIFTQFHFVPCKDNHILWRGHTESGVIAWEIWLLCLYHGIFARNSRGKFLIINATICSLRINVLILFPVKLHFLINKTLKRQYCDIFLLWQNKIFFEW